MCSYRGVRGVSAYLVERCESSCNIVRCVTWCPSCFLGFQVFASTNSLGYSACSDGASTVSREESKDERSSQQRKTSTFVQHTYRHAYTCAHKHMLNRYPGSRKGQSRSQRLEVQQRTGGSNTKWEEGRRAPHSNDPCLAVCFYNRV